MHCAVVDAHPESFSSQQPPSHSQWKQGVKNQLLVGLVLVTLLLLLLLQFLLLPLHLLVLLQLLLILHLLNLLIFLLFLLLLAAPAPFLGDILLTVSMPSVTSQRADAQVADKHSLLVVNVSAHFPLCL